MSDFDKLLNDTRNVREVTGIQFGIMSPEIIKAGSVVHVTLPEAYDGENPIVDGVFDSRMGVSEFGRACDTCGFTVELCPGHFGHIELALPVFFHHFTDSVLNVLKSVCFRCSRILIDKSDPVIIENIRVLHPQKRIKYIKGLAEKVSHCPTENCGCPRPKFYKVTNKTGKKDADGVIAIKAEFSSEDINNPDVDPTITVSPASCYMILKKISGEDAELLGFSNEYSRPEWMICKVLPVPPPAVRPSVRDGNQRRVDDLTHSLIQIVKSNTALKEALDKNVRKDVNGNHALLQYYVAMYMNNDPTVAAQNTHRNGRPLKGIVQRWKEKTGRMRWNLMGKRANMTGRTVASVGVNIGVEEFGIPREIAMNLTYPEIVTRFNIDKMYQLVRNGPHKYPGAKAVKFNSGHCPGQDSCTHRLEVIDTMKVVLNYGDVVHRHILNGDYGLFNRQPSLHRMSMMGHRIRVTENKSFRLNVFATAPYNADFDGDELNMHMPQSLMTSQELKDIAAVSKQIIDPATSKPVIKVTQDSIMGAYEMTAPETRLEMGEMMNLMINNTNFAGVLPAPGEEVDGVAYWTGHELFSTILPDITIELKNGSGDKVEVVEGRVVAGQIDSKVLDGLIQPIHNIYDSTEALKFLDNAQNLLIRWMVDLGASISFGSHLPSRELIAQIGEVLDQDMVGVYEVMQRAQQGVYLQELPTALRNDAYEQEMMAMLGQITNKVGKMVKENLSAQPFNSYYNAIVSGTKGKWDNSQQVMGLVAQQSIWGQRVLKGFTNRTLPHYPKYCDSPESRGYCWNSFMGGLTPSELFFHAMSGRVGVIDTAIKTARSGYITRRMTKALEDVKVVYDMTVRNANNKIVQFSYGDDNFDPIKLERDSIRLIAMNDEEMEKEFRFTRSGKRAWGEILPKKVVEELFKVADWEARLEAEVGELYEMRSELRTVWFPRRDSVGEIDVYFPFKLFRLVRHVMGKFELNGKGMSDLNPIYVIDQVEALCQDAVKYLREKGSALYLLRVQLKTGLSAKRCIEGWRITKGAFDFLLQLLREKIMGALVAPGEMVGCIASQSLGEIVMQLSVLRTEKVMLRYALPEGDKIMVGEIGDIIDSLLEVSDVQDLGSDSVVALPDFPIYISTVDCNTEKTEWRQLSEISRHPANGGMVKVITNSGRSCVTTLSHSHLQRTIDGKIIPKVAGDLVVGDCIPVCKKLNCEVLYETEFYDDEMDFTYELDFINGWMIGAYLSEGHINGGSQIGITNISDAFAVRVNEFAEKHGGKVRTRDFTGQIIPDYPEYTSRTHHISGLSKIAEFILKHCGKGSAGKHLPAFALFSNEEFVCGLLRGYFDGDGNIEPKYQLIKSHSISKDLTEGVALLLNRFGIFSTFGVEKPNRPNPLHVLRIIKADIPKFVESIGSDITEKREALQSIMAYINRAGAKQRDVIDVFPSETISPILDSIGAKLVIRKKYNLRTYKKCRVIGRQTVENFYNIFSEEAKLANKMDEIADDMALLKQAIENDIVWDRITSIEYLEDPKDYVYDFGVAGNHTFVLHTGVYVHNTLNTFHFSGVGAKSVVTTEGAPRIEEIITLSRKMKTPSADIYLREGYRFNKQKAEGLRATLEYTRLEDLVSESQIIYQGAGNQVVDEEDLQFMMLTDHLNEILELDQREEAYLPLMLRFVFNREAIFYRNITLSDIQMAILRTGTLEDYIQSYISDDNSGELVMRMKIMNEGGDEESSIDFIEELKREMLNITLRGVSGIKNVSRYESNIVTYLPDGTAQVEKEWALNTNGTNLEEILSYDIVDPVRTTSNDIHEIERIFGIEAARAKIIEEFDEVYKAETDAATRHIYLLSDAMTYTGRMLTLSRNGLPNRSEDTGPIAKASNEEIADMIINAAKYHELDNMKGTSANVMMGQFVPCGTNAFSLMFDEEAFLSSASSEAEYPVYGRQENDPKQISETIDTLYTDLDSTFETTDADFDFEDPVEPNQFSLGPPLKVAPPVEEPTKKPQRKRMTKKKE